MAPICKILMLDTPPTQDPKPNICGRRSSQSSMLRWVETTTDWGKLLYSAAKNQIQSQSGLFQGTLVDSRIIFIENTTFILICYQVHNDSWKYTYHYKSHSWKQPCLYILLGSIQNEKIDTLLNKWYKKILYVERFNFLLTNLHFLVTA